MFMHFDYYGNMGTLVDRNNNVNYDRMARKKNIDATQLPALARALKNLTPEEKNKIKDIYYFGQMHNSNSGSGSGSSSSSMVYYGDNCAGSGYCPSFRSGGCGTESIGLTPS